MASLQESQDESAGKRRRVLLAYNSSHERHDGKMNECAGRVRAVVEELQSRGLWDQCDILDSKSLSSTMLAEAQALALHSAKHLEELRTSYGNQDTWNCAQCTLENSKEDTCCQVCGAMRSGNFIIPPGKSDVYLCKESLSVALYNVGVCMEAASQLLLCQNTVASGFCLVRPPGHHASSEHYGSYCLINTVAVVAKSMLTTTRGNHVSRILILDFDVHHGDGTQKLVQQDAILNDHCMFISIHRHDDNFWPTSGTIEEGGENIVNIPLWGVGYGDSDYFYVFEHVVLPLAERFAPDLILVSAGYDCGADDLLGRFQVTPNGFGHLTKMVVGAIQVPTLFVLEGGYDVDASGDCPHMTLCTSVAATIQILLELASSDNVPQSVPADGWQDSVRPETKNVVDNVLQRVKL